MGFFWGWWKHPKVSDNGCTTVNILTATFGEEGGIENNTFLNYEF
jgi:hypothetical protein